MVRGKRKAGSHLMGDTDLRPSKFKYMVAETLNGKRKVFVEVHPAKNGRYGFRVVNKFGERQDELIIGRMPKVIYDALWNVRYGWLVRGNRSR